MSLTFANLVEIAKRTGVENWVDPKTGQRGQVIQAPSSHRGEQGSMGTVVGCTRHHTGTDEGFKSTADYPTFEVVKEGRAGLNNSLSAYGLGRWYGIYVFSEDISWHAGAWNWMGITDGNGHFLGIEAEGTGKIWTPFQREFYPRLCAAILDFIGEDIDMMPRHMDGCVPPGRKTDAANLWGTFQSTVQGYLDHPSTLYYTGEEDMPSLVDIAKAVWAFTVAKVENKDLNFSVGPARADTTLRHAAYHATVGSILGQQNSAKLDALAKLVAEDAANDLTLEQVQQAFAEAVKNVPAPVTIEDADV